MKKKTKQSEPKDRRATLEAAVDAMQAKIEEKIHEFREMELSQTVTSTQGDLVIKSNPAMGEFRALVRDYASALKQLEDLKGAASDGEDELAALRAELMVM